MNYSDYNNYNKIAGKTDTQNVNAQTSVAAATKTVPIGTEQTQSVATNGIEINNNSDNNKSSEDTITLKDVYNSIAWDKFGISKEKAERFDLLQKFYHISLTRKSVKEINFSITIAIEKIKKANNGFFELNAETAEQIINNTADTYLVIKNYNVNSQDDANKVMEDYNKRIENGEVSSLRKLLGLNEDEEITEEAVKKFAEKLKQQMKEAIEKLNKSNLSAEEKANKIKTVISEQRIQFDEILAATDINDRKHIVHILKNLFAENRGAALADVLNSLDKETRDELLKDKSYAIIRDICEEPDILGKSADALKVTESVTKQMDEKQKIEFYEDIIREYKKCNVDEIKAELETAENKKLLEVVQQKLNNGEELTDREKQLYKKYIIYKMHTGMISGSIISAGDNENLLREFINQANNLGTYRNILERINERINSNSDYDYTDFEKLLNKTTNGNYDIVKTDLENGTTTQLNPQPNSSSASGSSAGKSAGGTSATYVTTQQYTNNNTATTLGFKQDDNSETIAELKTQTNEKKFGLYSAETEVTTESSPAVASVSLTSTGIQNATEQYIKNYGGVKKLCRDCLNKLPTNQALNAIFKSQIEGLQEAAALFYDNLNFKDQAQIIKEGLKNSAFYALYTQTKDKAWSLVNSNSTNAAVTSKIEEKQEDAEQKVTLA